MYTWPSDHHCFIVHIVQKTISISPFDASEIDAKAEVLVCSEEQIKLLAYIENSTPVFDQIIRGCVFIPGDRGCGVPEKNVGRVLNSLLKQSLVYEQDSPWVTIYRISPRGLAILECNQKDSEEEIASKEKEEAQTND